MSEQKTPSDKKGWDAFERAVDAAVKSGPKRKPAARKLPKKLPVGKERHLDVYQLALSALLWLFVIFNASADEASCVALATSAYVKANGVLLSQTQILMSINATVEQRRLQESYCLQVAKCQVASMPPQKTTMALDAAFSSCLGDEAKEKYDLK